MGTARGWEGYISCLLGEGQTGTHTIVHVWRPEDNLRELVFSFSCGTQGSNSAEAFCQPRLAFLYVFFNFLKCVLSACMSTTCIPGTSGGQKREVLDPLKLELDFCELPCRCWELSLGSLEEQPSPAPLFLWSYYVDLAGLDFFV